MIRFKKECFYFLAFLPLMVGCQSSTGDQGKTVRQTAPATAPPQVPSNIPPEAQERMQQWQTAQSAQQKQQNEVMNARLQKKN